MSHLTNSRRRGLGIALPFFAAACLAGGLGAAAGEKAPPRTYQNELTPLAHPRPILADFPEFVQPV